MGDVIWDDGCYWTFTTYSLFRHGRVQVICRFIYLGGGGPLTSGNLDSTVAKKKSQTSLLADSKKPKRENLLNEATGALPSCQLEKRTRRLFPFSLAHTQTHIRGATASHSIRVYDEYLWWEAFALWWMSRSPERRVPTAPEDIGLFGLLLDFATPFECCVAHSSRERGSMFFFSPTVLLVSAIFPSQFYFRPYTECLLIVIFFLSSGYKFRLPAQIGGASGWILGWDSPTRCSNASTSFLFFFSLLVSKRKKKNQNTESTMKHKKRQRRTRNRNLDSLGRFWAFFYFLHFWCWADSF